jgi:hypothetical protein
VVDRDQLAGGEAGPHPHRPGSARQLPLQRDRRAHSVQRVGEHGHRGVALDSRAEPAAAMDFDVAIDDQLHLGQQRGRTLRRLLPQPSRLDDIGEQNCRDAGRSQVVPSGTQSFDQLARCRRTPSRIDRQPGP